MTHQHMSPADKEKQEFVKNIAIAWPIILIAAVVAFSTGAWFVCLCSAAIAWPLVKHIEEIFDKELVAAKAKLFKWMDAFADMIPVSGLSNKNAAFSSTSATESPRNADKQSQEFDTSRTLRRLKVQPGTVSGMYADPGLSAATTSSEDLSSTSPSSFGSNPVTPIICPRRTTIASGESSYPARRHSI